MAYSYLSHLSCARTELRYDADQIQNLSASGAPLLARYDLDALRDLWRPEQLLSRPPTLWRYHELLPVRDPRHIVTLGEGMTPLLPLSALGKAFGLADL